ncbi:hypothetical protein J4Q44_G00171510 [Coregonus suidteri]|uniref:Uncharacterized protein n=1 Tax=Coregonus suidteri TaxID=861788 RepID=A0AAN8LN11_9TELE
MRPPEDVLDEETSPSSSCDSPGTNKAQGDQQQQELNTPNVPPLVALIRKRREAPQVPSARPQTAQATKAAAMGPQPHKQRFESGMDHIWTVCQSYQDHAARRFGLKEALEGEDWSVYWADSTVSLDRCMDMKCYQKKHFPGMMEQCRKNMLARNMNHMLKSFPKEYNIFPCTWCLSADYSDFQAYTRAKKHKADGFKFDLRIYVDILRPLRIFLYKERLARYNYPTCNNVPTRCSTPQLPHLLPTLRRFQPRFGILGFDVLIDHRLKPWPIEINHSPSFTTNSRLDRLLYDTLVLINLGACDRRKATEEERRRIRDRLQNVRSKETMSKEQSQQQASSVERALSYEDQHLGGFRRIFPSQGGEEYDKYLKHSSSLFQEPAATKARDRCTREQLQELHEKQSQRRCQRLDLQGESAGEKGQIHKVPLCPVHPNPTGPGETKTGTPRGWATVVSTHGLCPGMCPKWESSAPIQSERGTFPLTQ